jgi:2-polyprenyl-3-methyl-5-hydroxy-6-metoxy-1,4-benzoquinol methylase
MNDPKFSKTYFAEMYDGDYDKKNPAYKFKDYVRQIKRFGKINSKLLDVGCAYGLFLKEAQKTFHVTGSDISEYAVEIAKSRLPHVKFYCTGIVDVPESETYEIVTAFDVLEHVPCLNEALSKIKLLLKSNGLLVITVPVYDTLIGKVVERLDKDPTHIHKNSRYWWLDILKSNGFEIKSFKGAWRYYFKRIGYIHFMSKWFQKFSPAIFIIVQKMN